MHVSTIDHDPQQAIVDRFGNGRLTGFATGRPIAGTWQLIVTDGAPKKRGKITSLSLSFDVASWTLTSGA